MNRTLTYWFSIGAVTFGLYWLFLRKRLNGSPVVTTTRSSSEVQADLAEILPQKGYSKRQAWFWFLVANMETAGFTSNLFVTYHNPWGMKQPKKRATTSTGATSSGFAQYADIPAAVNDLVLYLKEWGYPADFKTLDAQLVFMKSKGYFGGENLETYRGKVIAWANKFGYPISA